LTNYHMDEIERQNRHPKHYHDSLKIEPIEYIIANDMDFLAGNIIKYVSRFPFKGGVDDLQKAKKYLELLIERENAK